MTLASHSSESLHLPTPHLPQIRPHQNEWKALHQSRQKWLADIRQHSPSLSADRAAELFEEHFERVNGRGDVWRMRFNRRSTNPLEWISVDFFSKGRALDPRFLRFLMSMTWRMKTPEFREQVPLPEFVRDRTEAEDRDAKDIFLLAHRFLYDACPHGLQLQLPAPLAPVLHAPLEEWKARGLVKGALKPAAGGGTVRVRVERDALDLVTYDLPLLPHLLAAVEAQRPEARAHYRKIIAKEANSRTCFFRLYSNVRFLTVFGPLEPALVEMIASAPVGGPPSSGASTASGGSSAGAVAKRGAGEAKKQKKKGSVGSMKRKTPAGSGGGGGSKKRIKREDGNGGYVAAGYYGKAAAAAAAQRQPSGRARRAAVGKPKADDEFCYSWSDADGEQEEEEEEEVDHRRSSLGASSYEGTDDGWGVDGTQDMLPSQDDDDEWEASGGASLLTKPPPSLLASSTSSSGSSATAAAAVLVPGSATTGGGSCSFKKVETWKKELDAALVLWYPKTAEGDHTTLWEAPCDPTNSFERWCYANHLSHRIAAGAAAGATAGAEATPPSAPSFAASFLQKMAAQGTRRTGVVRDVLCHDQATMAVEGEGERKGEEGEEDLSQSVAASIAPVVATVERFEDGEGKVVAAEVVVEDGSPVSSYSGML